MSLCWPKCHIQVKENKEKEAHRHKSRFSMDLRVQDVQKNMCAD